jgi:rubredoxin
MAVYKCSVCETIYDEEKEGKKWEHLGDDWVCHVCESDKSCFEPAGQGDAGKQASGPGNQVQIAPDHFEIYMKDIHKMAETGESLIEPMRTKVSTFSWNDVLIKGAQLAKIPLNRDEPVNTKTVIGPM